MITLQSLAATTGTNAAAPGAAAPAEAGGDSPEFAALLAGRVASGRPVETDPLAAARAVPPPVHPPAESEKDDAPAEPALSADDAQSNPSGSTTDGAVALAPWAWMLPSPGGDPATGTQAPEAKTDAPTDNAARAGRMAPGNASRLAPAADDPKSALRAAQPEAPAGLPVFRTEAHADAPELSPVSHAGLAQDIRSHAAAAQVLSAAGPAMTRAHDLQPAPLSVPSAVGTPGWTADVHHGISLLVQERSSVAELRLTPAELGPLRIRIDYSDGQPNVVISAQHADTRDALDAALPRLRDMLAQSGVSLGGSSVDQRGGGQGDLRDGAPSSAAPRPDLHSAGTDLPAGTLRSSLRMAVNRLIDTYA